MKITKRLRKHLTKKFGLAADATDEVVKALVEEKLKSGELSAKKLEKLTAKKEPDAAGKLQKLIAQSVSKAVAGLIPAPAGAGTPPVPPVKDAKAPGDGTPPVNGQETPPAKTPDLAEVIAKSVKEAVDAKLAEQKPEPPGMVSLLAKASSVLQNGGIRVKSAWEQYDHTKTAAVYPKQTRFNTPHPLAGERARHGNVPLDMPSKGDLALCSAYFKWCVSMQPEATYLPRCYHLNDHEKDLIQYALHEKEWWGGIGRRGEDSYDHEVNRRKLSEFEIKALLDDTTSGGIEIAPVEFDDALVVTPVLFGELYPLVNVVNLSRGRRVKGGAVTNPTITSGVAEGTSIQAFNTGSFVGAFDTPVFTAVGAMEVGLDFEEDSPTNVGQIIVQKYGEKFMEWLDRVIAVGDGVTEPQGIFNASSVTAIQADNSTTGGPTISDYEGLMFGVAKQFRNTKGARNVYMGNETSYRRARAIPVGPGDERRVFGMTHADYTLLDRPYKIQANITNNQIGFANLGYYRMYRRLGLNIRIETAGNYLALKNLRLIVVRARYGGQLELSGAAAVITDAMN